MPLNRPTDAEEVDAFKRELDLRAFLGADGYGVDAKASSRSSSVMIHLDGDKLLVGVAEDGHWVYFSVRDPDDHGTVIDYEQRRRGGSLGEVRVRLRAALGKPPAAPPGASTPLHPVTRDVVQARARWADAGPLEGCLGYLVGRRGIAEDLLRGPTFEGRIRSDGRGNAVFPHWDEEGICGFELKNAGFTGFSPGGCKGLWVSRVEGQVEKVVVTETTIDAISHAALFGAGGTRFVSTAGQMSPQQRRLLQATVTRELVRAGSSGLRLVIATDADPGGDSMANAIWSRLAVNAKGLKVARHRPPYPGWDWNDVLRAS